jgi:hypothetical protein
MSKLRMSNTQIRIWFVTLFALLLIFGSMVQLTHVHKDGAAHSDCALCQSAHNVVRPSASPCIQPVFVAIIRLAPPVQPQYREHIFSFSHWNRPPPDQTANS